MKRTLYFLLAASLLLGCSKDKNSGNIRHIVQYTTAKTSLKIAGGNVAGGYTQFGDYITSATPYILHQRSI